MVYGGCQKYANAFMGHPLTSNLTLIMVERNAVRNAVSNVIVAPYPDQFCFYVNHVALYPLDTQLKSISL